MLRVSSLTMIFMALVVLVQLLATERLVLVFAESSSTQPQCSASLYNQWKQQRPPYVTPQTWLPEFVATDFLPTMQYKDVIVSCGVDDDDDNDSDEPTITDNKRELDAGCSSATTVPKFKQITIGKMPQFDTEHSMAVLNEAINVGWDGGYGIWPQMSLQARINAMELFLDELQKSRTDIVQALQWEIQKNHIDAAAEFDRTIQFAKQVIYTARTDKQFHGFWQSIGPTKIFTKRTAIGIVLCLAPYNYPINESYAAIIPALLMGNVIILKIPTVGGLAHLLTMNAFAKAFPKGTVNFIAGGGRTTMPPLMETGHIDVLSFIGGKNAANQLLHIHPQPHRLKVFLQLEAKNMGIFLNNLFVPSTTSGSALSHSISEAITGTLSYNGQRCTALKLLFVPTNHATTLVKKLCEKVNKLPVGLPWQVHDGDLPSKITPLPTMDRIKYMKELLIDAIEKGAQIMNENGGTIIGNSDNSNSSTLMIPAIVYPVIPGMRLYTEEQFGPVIAVSPYDSIDTVYEYAQSGIYGQQVSVFTDDSVHDDPEVYQLIDKFAPIFGKININSQCGRSPDTVPFSGRRSSALGVMSVKDAMLEFSIPTVLSYNTNNIAGTIRDSILPQTMDEHSLFVQQAM